MRPPKAKNESLDVAEAVTALFVNAGEVARLAVLFLIVTENRQEALVHKDLLFWLNFLESAGFPDEDEVAGQG